MQNLQPPLDPGTLVRARGELWYVRRSRAAARVSLVVLEGAETTNARRHATLLTPIDRIEPVRSAQPVRRRRYTVAARIVDAAGAVRPAEGLWSLSSAHLELLPWQLTPALAVVHGATRLLLADAVGLGKTVEAGLIVSELRTRGAAERALILTPAALRENWAAELRTRFALPVTVFDHAALIDLEHRLPSGANPWAAAPIVVSSIDLVKRPEVWLAVESAPFDVLVVDEAHHATPGTDRLAAVARLAEQVPWVVLATATPHSGDAAAFRALLDIGATGEADSPIRVFRRSHRNTPLQARRRTHVVRIVPNAGEALLHDGVLRYARALCNGPGVAPGTVLLASLLARRATSSPAAAAATLRRRLGWLERAAAENGPATPALPWEELELDDELPTEAVRAAGLASPAEELARVTELLRLAEAAAPHWSKLQRLRRMVDAIDEPLIVFTEYTATLDACVAGLGHTATMTSLHGGLSLRERQHRLRRFLDGTVRILVTTDVAGEGLNLQQSARVVVTLEWPWSPLRLEQRVGRVHRLGQQRTVHAFHLTAAGTYEETVVARLLARGARAADALASHEADTVRRIESEVLETGARNLVEVPSTPTDDTWDRAAAVEVQRIAAWRRLRRRTVMVDAQPHPAWAAPRRCGAAARVAVLVEVSRGAVVGGTSASMLVALSVVPCKRPRHRGDWRRLCRRLAADPRILDRAVAEARASWAVAEDGWASVRRRLAGIRARRGRQHEAPLQTSLFDRRALLAGEQRQAVRARWDRWQDELLARLQPADVVERARLVAILPMPEQRR